MTAPQRLPEAPTVRLIALVEQMHRTPGPDSLSRLARRLRLDLDSLLPLLAAVQLLGWATVHRGRYDLTENGRAIAEADEGGRRQMFREGARQAPVVSRILAAIEAAGGHPVAREAVLTSLSEGSSEAEAVRQFDTAVDWGRYGELFDYDAASGFLTRIP